MLTRYQTGPRNLTPAARGALRRRVPIRIPAESVIHSEALDASANWSAYRCTAAETSDDAHVRTYATAAKSLIQTPDAGGVFSTGSLTRDLTGSPVNCTGAQVIVRFNILAGSGASAWTHIEQLGLRLKSGALAHPYDLTNNFTYRLATPAPSDVATGKIGPGWYERAVCVDDYHSSDGSTAINAITYIDLTMQRDADVTQLPQVVWDGLWIVDGPTKARLTLAFDGAWDGQHDAARLLNSEGVRATFLVCDSLVGIAGRMTLAQVQELPRMGHEVGVYGEGWGTKTDAAKRAWIRRQQNWLIRNGLGPGRSLSVGGTDDWNTALEQTLIPDYLDSYTMISGQQAGNKSVVSSGYLPHAILRRNAFSNALLASCQANVTAARGCGGKLAILVHDLDGADWTGFVTFVTGAGAGNIRHGLDDGTLECLTMAEQTALSLA